MAGLDITTDLATEPLIVDLAKRQLQLDASYTDDDDYLANVLIPAARESAELHTARSYGVRSFREYFDGFPGQRLPIPYNYAIDIPSRHQFESLAPHRFELSRSPLVQVTQVQYLDQDGATQTLDPSVYTVSDHKDPASIFRAAPSAGWPVPLYRVDSVWVDYDAGYADGKLPAIALQAMLLLLSHWFENRTPVAATAGSELPFTVTNLLDKNRVYYQA
jgi:hypothetical protein